MVMAVGSEVVGYLSFFFAKKTVLIDEIKVLLFHCRNGYAINMVRRLQTTLESESRVPSGKKAIGVKVAEKNLAALLFFRRCGFKWVRTISHSLPGYDTYAMRYSAQCWGLHSAN